jgi:small subunit ribosomal protein S17
MSKKVLKGIVLSDKMKKTLIVEVERWVHHSRYKKRYRRTKKYKAHDEKNECKIGDSVIIEETRPISKEKKWKVIKRMS